MDALGNELTNRRNWTKSEIDDLRLQILNNAPFTMWACDSEARLVYWDKNAQTTYGYSGEEALGNDYVQMIVHEDEKDNSYDDVKLAASGARAYKSTLANDHTKDGQSVRIITCCGHVRDPQTKEGLHGEVGVAITHLQELEIELEKIHKQATEIQKLRREMFEAEKSHILQRIANALLSWDTRATRPIERQSEFLDSCGPGAMREDALSKKMLMVKSLRREREELNHMSQELIERIASARNKDALDKLRTEVDHFMSECDRNL